MRRQAVIFLLQRERFICLTNQFSGTDLLACSSMLSSRTKEHQPSGDSSHSGLGLGPPPLIIY